MHKIYGNNIRQADAQTRLRVYDTMIKVFSSGCLKKRLNSQI